MQDDTVGWKSPWMARYLESMRSTRDFIADLSGNRCRWSLREPVRRTEGDDPSVAGEAVCFVGDRDEPVLVSRFDLSSRAWVDAVADWRTADGESWSRYFDPNDDRDSLHRVLQPGNGESDGVPDVVLAPANHVDHILYEGAQRVGDVTRIVSETSLFHVVTGAASFADLIRWLAKSGEAADNVLCDQLHRVSYAEIPALLAGITEQLTRKGATPETGVVLECVNTLPGALTVLALLSGGFHVHLTPARTTSAGKANAEVGGPLFFRHRVRIGSGLSDDTIRIDRPDTFLHCSVNPDYAPAAQVEAGGALYVKTSGSLGTPKLAVHRIHSFLRNAFAVSERLQLTARDRVTIPVPIFHMYGLGAGFMPSFLVGASIDFQENSNLLRYLGREPDFDPNIAFVTPSFCETLLNRRSNRTYRYLVSAGERMSEATFRNVESRMGPVINLYGSTEMGVIAATRPMLSSSQRCRTVGDPIAGTDVDLQPCSEKPESGPECHELMLRSANGFAGYVDVHGRPLDPGCFTASGWYRTGDLVQVSEDGLIAVLGRNSLSLNRNGYLVVFAEIEQRIRAMEGIERVALTTRSGTGRDDTLVAFCELRRGKGRLSGSEIRARCLDILPRFAVPDEFQVLEALPVLANGKVDRQALAALTSESDP